MQRDITRRKFIQWAANIIILPGLVIWYKLVEKDSILSGKLSNLYIPMSALSDRVNFLDGVIAIKDDQNKISFYSSKCPHLGCDISKFSSGKIICPCHGSEYDLKGYVIKGPAAKGLTKLVYSRDDSTGNYIIQL